MRHVTAEGMALQPVAHRFNERRPVAAPSTSNCGSRNGMDGDRIRSINTQAGHVVCLSLVSEAVDPRILGNSGVFSVLIVLTDKHHR